MLNFMRYKKGTTACSLGLLETTFNYFEYLVTYRYYFKSRVIQALLMRWSTVRIRHDPPFIPLGIKELDQLGQLSRWFFYARGTLMGQ